MSSLLNMPVVLFGSAFFSLALSTRLGALLKKTVGELREDNRDEFAFVLTATLTLLGLIIGFAFSMSISRYDQRKTYEEEEANAIGTEYLRCGLLSGSEAVGVQALLTQYLNQRILFYESDDPTRLGTINTQTYALQKQMWSEVQTTAASRPSVTLGLVVSGMNDVINSRGYTEAAWLNRIPTPAWVLMVSIAICCNVLMGYGVRQRRTFLLLVLPLVIAIALFLIAEIDSPRGGLIRVLPINLIDLGRSLAS
jgi:cytochrome bd-type quinol oxidase subunit 2